MTPWTDRAGRFSLLKFITFLLILTPGVVLAYSLWAGSAGAKPVTHAIHDTGDWAIRFLLLSLAVTPLRRIGDWSKLIGVRRMLGLAALCYGLFHLGFYVVDQRYDLIEVGREIALRIYLTIGFLALLGMCALGATSTDHAIRKMGANWRKLHKLTYGIALLVIIHYFLQSKVDVTQATLVAGLFMLSMLYRLMQQRKIPFTPLWLVGAAVLATALTMAVETGWFALMSGIQPERVFWANFDFRYSIRPCWWVGGVAVALAGVSIVRSLVPAKALRAVLPQKN